MRTAAARVTAQAGTALSPVAAGFRDAGDKQVLCLAPAAMQNTGSRGSGRVFDRPARPPEGPRRCWALEFGEGRHGTGVTAGFLHWPRRFSSTISYHAQESLDDRLDAPRDEHLWPTADRAVARPRLPRLGHRGPTLPGRPGRHRR